jgi:peptidoglycan-associated lipoprotein
MKTLTNGLLVSVIAVGLSACSGLGGTQNEAEQASVEDRSTQADGTSASGAQASGAQAGAAFSGHELDNPGSLLSKRVIYFEYDSSSIRSEDRELIRTHAAYMSANSGSVAVLEGHADERGSREYNIALGEQRAKAVRQLLLFQGAADRQLETVSYGEERPAASGHDEASWRQNRRVEIVYRVR